MQLQNAALGLGAAAIFAVSLLAISARLGESTASAQASREGQALAEKFAAEPKDAEAKAATEQARKEAERAAEQARQRADVTRRQEELEAYDRRKADEADMLARAQAEARGFGRVPALRQQDEDHILAEAERVIAAAKSAERDRIAADGEGRRAREYRALTEQRRLEQARRLIEDQRLARIEAEQRHAVDGEQRERARDQALESTREDELNRISEKIRRAQVERAAKAAREDMNEPAPPGIVRPAENPAAAVALREPEPTPALGTRDPVLPSRAPVESPARDPRLSQPAAPRVELEPAGPPRRLDPPDSILPPRTSGREPAGVPTPRSGLPLENASPVRATVLLLMRPGDRGIRRFNKSADPVLCMGQRCYVSQGPDLSALEMTRARAFGTLNTLGQRAWACNNHLGCVFRNVELVAPALVQPVDLRVISHDRREPSDIHIDTSCRVDGGRLQCGGAVRARTYVLWAVPEAVATNAGPALLEAALNAGLPAGQTAAAVRN